MIVAGTDTFRHEDMRTAILVEQQEYNLVGLLKPSIMLDGNKWCVLYGANLMEGIAGFGDTPIEAIYDFNRAFHRPGGSHDRRRH